MAKIIKEKVKSMNRNWKNFLDKNYLGSHNLEEGEEMLLTIAKFVGEEEVVGSDGKKTTKTVFYFKENVPKMIMNITNGNTISMLYGLHPDNWVGKKIQIYATPVKAFGKTQDALRIRDFKPKENVDVIEYKEKLDSAKNLTELANIWKSFPLSIKSIEQIESYKNTLKSKLTN